MTTTTRPQVPDSPAGMPEFTDEQIRALVDYMEAAGKARGYEQGASFSEVDFLAGCMATLFALQKQNRIPAGWIFTTMAGRSPLDLPTLDRSVYVVHDPKNRREPITLYENASNADDHVSYLADDLNNEDVWRYSAPVRHSLRPDIAKALGYEPET